MNNNSSSTNDESTRKNAPRADKAACWVRSARSEFYLEFDLSTRFILNAICGQDLYLECTRGATIGGVQRREGVGG